MYGEYKCRDTGDRWMIMDGAEARETVADDYRWVQRERMIGGVEDLAGTSWKGCRRMLRRTQKAIDLMEGLWSIQGCGGRVVRAVQAERKYLVNGWKCMCSVG